MLRRYPTDPYQLSQHVLLEQDWSFNPLPMVRPASTHFLYLKWNANSEILCSGREMLRTTASILIVRTHPEYGKQEVSDEVWKLSWRMLLGISRRLATKQSISRTMLLSVCPPPRSCLWLDQSLTFVPNRQEHRHRHHWVRLATRCRYSHHIQYKSLFRLL